MALPSLGETYSLLADVRTSDIKRQRDEERRYRKDVRRDQLKAALLQPLVGAAATTGLEIAGNVASKVFLGDKVNSFVTSEAGRNALSAAKGNVLLKNKINEEHKIYAAPDGINIWTNKIVDDLIAQSGATKDDEKAIIRSNVVHNKKQNQESLQAHIDDLEDKKLFLSTLPTEEQIRARAKDKNIDNFFAKSKIQKLLAKGASYLGGKSIEELMERSTNLILTGSTDSKYAPEIRETFKTSKGRQIFINLINGTLSGDDAAIDEAVNNLKDTPFYKSIATSTGLREEQIVDFDTFYAKFNSAVSQGYEDSVYNKVLESPDFTQVVNDKDLSKLQTLVDETIFGSAEDIKNLGSNLLLDENFYKVFTSLETNDTAGKRENSLALIVKDNVSFISNVLARKTNDDFNLGAYSPAVIKGGLREYLSTQITNKKITIDEDSGLLFVKELSESDRIEGLQYSIKEYHRFVKSQPVIEQGIADFIATLTQGIETLNLNDELSNQEKNNLATAAGENAEKVLEQGLTGIMSREELAKYESYKDALRGFQDSIAEDFYFTRSPKELRPWLKRAENIEYKNVQTYQRPWLQKVESKLNSQKDTVQKNTSLPDEEKKPPSLLEKPLKFLTGNYPTDLKGKIKFLGEEIFKDDANSIKFMERLIQQESRMGQDPGTYSLSGEPGKRGSYGVAQVDEPAFDQVQKKLNKPDSTIYKYIKPFEEATGVDLRDIQYEDLKEDILSIAIGRLYLMQHTEDPIPTEIEDQGRYWKTNFNTEAGAGTPEQFVVNNQK